MDISGFISAINSLHVPTVLILASIFFLLIALVGGNLKAGIQIPSIDRRQRIAIGTIGIIFLILGSLTATMPAFSSPTPVTTGSSPTPVTTGPISDPQTYYTHLIATAPIWQDSLANQDNNGWEIVNDTVRGRFCAFENNSYVVTRTGLDYKICSLQSPVWTNFLFRVQMKISSGDYSGIVFRSDAYSKFYYFRIDRNGEYQFKVSIDHSSADDKMLMINPSSLTDTGLGTSNAVAVLAIQSYFYLFLNDHYVGYATDTTYQAGQIGFLAGNSISDQAVVAFNDAKVWQLV